MPILMSNYWWGITLILIGIWLEYKALTTNNTATFGICFYMGTMCIILGTIGLIRGD
jgi:membrane-bound ClpP family serine protease